MVPTAGLIDHVTSVLVAFVTVAVSCCACESTREAVAGVTETLTGGLRVTEAVAVFVVSATLVAIMVWACPG